MTLRSVPQIRSASPIPAPPAAPAKRRLWGTTRAQRLGSVGRLRERQRAGEQSSRTAGANSWTGGACTGEALGGRASRQPRGGLPRWEGAAAGGQQRDGRGKQPNGVGSGGTTQGRVGARTTAGGGGGATNQVQYPPVGWSHPVTSSRTEAGTTALSFDAHAGLYPTMHHDGVRPLQRMPVCEVVQEPLGMRTSAPPFQRRVRVQPPYPRLVASLRLYQPHYQDWPQRHTRSSGNQQGRRHGRRL